MRKGSKPVVLWLLGGLLAISCHDSVQHSGNSEMHEQNADVFISGFNPRIVVPLTPSQRASVSSMAERLHKEGKSRQWVAPLPCGVFRIGGDDYGWYDDLLFRETSVSSARYVVDIRLKDLTERMMSFNENPYDLNSNQWTQILTFLEPGTNVGGGNR